MNKALRIILLILLAIVFTLGSIGFCITAFVSWVWGGIRFSPEAAMEAVSLGSSEWERIESEDCYFYYRTFEDRYETSEDMSDWICDVTPVRKNGIGMWYASPDPGGYEVCMEGTETKVGYFIPIEVDGVYHNFFLPSTGGTNPPTLPALLSDGYTNAVVDGREHELFKHSYFVTESAVEKFEINGRMLIIDN